jgi:hypothetical protein
MLVESTNDVSSPGAHFEKRRGAGKIPIERPLDQLDARRKPEVSLFDIGQKLKQRRVEARDRSLIGETSDSSAYGG